MFQEYHTTVCDTPNSCYSITDIMFQEYHTTLCDTVVI